MTGLRKKDISKQILGIVNTGKIYELQTTSTSGGNVARGIPVQEVVKRHKIKAKIVKNIKEAWITTGLAKVGDVKLISSKQLTLSNQIEHDGVIYDIVEEIISKTIMGKFYNYVLRRTPKTTTSPDVNPTIYPEHGQKLVKQLLSTLDTDKIYELRLTQLTGGSVTRGIPPERVEKRHVLKSSRIVKETKEQWITTGLAKLGDITLVTSERIDMNNRIEHEEVIYDIIEVVEAVSYVGTFFNYILRRRQ